MEKWIIRNLKWFTLIFIALFIFKSVQSCNRKMSIKIMEKNLVYERDSIIKERDKEIELFKIDIRTKDYTIKDLTNEVDKVNKINEKLENDNQNVNEQLKLCLKRNVTIQQEFKGVEKDTTKKK